MTKTTPMGLPPFTMIIISIAAIVFVIFVVYVFFSKKTSTATSENEDENDELIFNPETGKYLTVEELIEEHGLDYLDEQKCQQVYDALSEDLKNLISYKDVETIMEFYYQLKTSALEEEELEEEAKYDFLVSIFEKKGRPIDREVLLQIIGIAEKNQTKAE
ncbi:MAG: hypothetical protein M3Q58_14565 [Bacteroidota bacterium]|nr:hypothetical protein [Bacteroidota bacterium]